MMDATAPKRRFLSARGAVLALVLLGLTFTSVYPLRRYMDVRQDIKALRAEERALDRRAAELQTQRELLQTDAEVERLARERLGMVRPGEQPFFIPASEPVPTRLPSVVATPASDGPGARPAALVGRWLDVLQSAFRVLG